MSVGLFLILLGLVLAFLVHFVVGLVIALLGVVFLATGQ